MPQSLQAALDFLQDLRFNNYRSWFEENRSRYEQALRAVESLVEDIIRRFDPVEDLGRLTPRECMFRIHRDVRFSKDKSPYKTAMGIVIGRGGRKAAGRAYYLHIEPADHAFIAAGIHDPTPEQLKTIRQAIAEQPQTLEQIISTAEFKRYFGAVQGEKLKTSPKGYSPDHPAIELLKQKQFLAVHPLTDDDLLREDFAAYVVEVCAALKPFENYIHTVLDRSERGKSS